MPSEAALATAYAARRCAVCGCAEVAAVCPGTDAVWEVVLIVEPNGMLRRRSRLVSSSVPDINLCLADAMLRSRGAA